MDRLKKEKKKIIIALLFPLSIVIGILLANVSYVYSLINKIDTVELNKDKLGISDNIEAGMATEKNHIKNIALLGVDSVDGAKGRSDTVMIATIDTEHKKLKLTSIMRDTYVSIPGRQNDKLNHAYAYGGPELSIQTLNQNFDLNIDDFVSVNFSTLPKIVDKLGGISIDVDTEELKYINDYIDHLNSINGTNAAHITNSGEQTLNGTQAMAYCRIRYTDGGDFKRTERNREVLIKMFNKMCTVSPIDLPDIIEEMLPMVQTSMEPFEILDLAKSTLKMAPELTIEQQRIPMDGYCRDKMINGVYYLTFDKDITVQKIHDYIFEESKEGV